MLNIRIEEFHYENPALPLPIPPPPPFAAPIFGVDLYDLTLTNWLYNNSGNPLEDGHFEIKVAFLNGTQNQKDKVIKYANEWLKYGPTVKYKFVNGIHGHIRVAFDDEAEDTKVSGDEAVRMISWSYVGRYSLSAITTPETMHLGNVNDKLIPAKGGNFTDEEKLQVRVIQHEFGHALGLRFAPPEPLKNPMENLLFPDTLGNWSGAAADTVQGKLGWWESNAQTGIKGDVLQTIERPDNIDPLLDPKTNPLLDGDQPVESVMGFGWRYDLSIADRLAIAQLYPIRAHLIHFSVQDFFEKSANHPDDLSVYVLDRYGVIFQNTRKFTKAPSKVRGEQDWSYWSRVIEDVPRNAKAFAVLDLSDRLEVLIIDRTGFPDNSETGILRSNYRLKTSDTWSGWFPDLPPQGTSPSLPRRETVKFKLLQIQDGYEVFAITQNVTADGSRNAGKLEHFVRRNGDRDWPKNMHPVPTTSEVLTIHAARVGPPTDPVQIYAGLGLEVYSAALDKSVLSWSLATLSIDKIADATHVHQLEFGVVEDTRHSFIIDNNRKLNYTRSNESGWFEWNDERFVEVMSQLPSQVQSVTVGVASSNDAEDDYLQVFVLDRNGNLYHNRVNLDGDWGWDDSEGNWDRKWRQYFKLGFDSAGFPPTKKVYTKRTKSGDLELFIIRGGNDDLVDVLERNRLNSVGWGQFERYIWWK